MLFMSDGWCREEHQESNVVLGMLPLAMAAWFSRMKNELQEFTDFYRNTASLNLLVSVHRTIHSIYT